MSDWVSTSKDREEISLETTFWNLKFESFTPYLGE
jgi:hypothetical protein